MALNEAQRKALRVALGSKGDNGVADEIADAIDASADPQLDELAAVGALAPVAAVISASNFTAAIPAEPTKAEVDVGIDALRTKVITSLGAKADNNDLESLRVAFDALVADLKAKGLMDS